MNEGPILSDFSPSWMDDGLGVSGEQGEQSFDNNTPWDTNAWSRQNQEPEDFINAPAAGCLNDAGDPPAMGTWVLGSVDGTCQWIDTTTCP